MSKLGFKDARHLVVRTGLGCEWGTIQRYQNLTRQQAIDYLLKNRDMSLPRPPDMSPWSRIVSLKGNMRRKKMIMHISKAEGKKLQDWWVKHLVKTRSPFLPFLSAVQTEYAIENECVKVLK